MTYEVAVYEPAFRSRVIELQRRVFGGSRRFAERNFRWKYEQNPYLPEPLFIVALSGSEVVGIRGFYGARWSSDAGGPSVLAPIAADTAVAPEHRGRWLFDQMMRVARDELRARGHDYAFNFSANPAVRQLSLRSGWRQPVLYRPWRYPSGDLATPGRLERAHRRIRRRFNRASPEFASLDRRGGLGSSEVAIDQGPRPAAMAALAERVRARTRGDAARLGHVRDEAFYGWRFGDPRQSYRFLFLERGDGIEGFVALQQFRGGGVIQIVDWAAEDASHYAVLLQEVLASGPAPLGIWSASLPDELLEVLRTSGFEPAPEDRRGRVQPGMFVTSTTDLAPDRWAIGDVPLLDATRWDLRMAYSDGA